MSPWSILTALSDCLCAALDVEGRPPLCFCGILPGAAAIQDYGPGGMAWVRLAQAYPSTTFPQPDSITGVLNAPLAYLIEVGVVRCAPLPTEHDLPSLQEQEAAAEQAIWDMQAMRDAIVCCLTTQPYDGTDLEYRLGQYTPLGPEGDTIGGGWQIVVQRS